MIVQSTDNTTIQLLIKRYDLKSLMARVCKPQVKWHISALSFEVRGRFGRGLCAQHWLVATDKLQATVLVITHWVARAHAERVPILEASPPHE